MFKRKSIKIRTFSGATTQDMKFLLVLVIVLIIFLIFNRLKKNHEKVVLHVEISNALPHVTPQEMYEDILESKKFVLKSKVAAKILF